jgi:hypothetical protein
VDKKNAASKFLNEKQRNGVQSTVIAIVRNRIES